MDKDTKSWGQGEVGRGWKREREMEGEGKGCIHTAAATLTNSEGPLDHLMWAICYTRYVSDAQPAAQVDI